MKYSTFGGGIGILVCLLYLHEIGGGIGILVYLLYLHENP